MVMKPGTYKGDMIGVNLMIEIKMVFGWIGVAVVSAVLYYVVTYLGSGAINGGFDNDENTALGGWFLGGVMFVAMTMAFAFKEGLI